MSHPSAMLLTYGAGRPTQTLCWSDVLHQRVETANTKTQKSENTKKQVILFLALLISLRPVKLREHYFTGVLSW